jgi:hypothetical protein
MSAIEGDAPKTEIEDDPQKAQLAADAPPGAPRQQPGTTGRRQEPESAGLTHAELSARVLGLGERARNVEEPLGTAQWPSGQLTELETKLLADAIRRRRAA